jgi:hypothetical protein
VDQVTRVTLRGGCQFCFSKFINRRLVLVSSSSIPYSVIVLTLAANDITQPRLPYTSGFPQSLCCASDQIVSRDFTQLLDLSHSMNRDWSLDACTSAQFCCEGWVLKRITSRGERSTCFHPLLRRTLFPSTGFRSVLHYLSVLGCSLGLHNLFLDHS